MPNVRQLLKERDVAALLEIVRGDRDSQVRREALDALVALRPPELLDLSLGLVGDRSIQVRAGAVVALGDFPDPRAAAALRAAASDPLLRAAASKSLERIGETPQEGSASEGTVGAKQEAKEVRSRGV